MQEVEASLNDVKNAISSDSENLKEEVEKLRSVSMKIGQQM